jgi:hypothetical protein
VRLNLTFLDAFCGQMKLRSNSTAELIGITVLTGWSDSNRHEVIEEKLNVPGLFGQAFGVTASWVLTFLMIL